MNPDDFRKLKKVEAILVRNYVDTAKLDVEVVGESCFISGELHIYEYGPEGHMLKDPVELRQAVKKTCLCIEQEIRRTGDVCNINWKLRNWEKFGSNWVVKKV